MIPMAYQLLIFAALSLMFATPVAAIKARNPPQFITWLAWIAGGSFVAMAALRLAVG